MAYEASGAEYFPFVELHAKAWRAIQYIAVMQPAVMEKIAKRPGGGGDPLLTPKSHSPGTRQRMASLIAPGIEFLAHPPELISASPLAVAMAAG